MENSVKRRTVRCARGFATVGGRANIEVWYAVVDFGYGITLFTCHDCGELFVLDFENPAFWGRSAEQIVRDLPCPRCGSPLSATIRAYPQTFRTEDGQVGHFDPPLRRPPDPETVFLDLLEIR